MTDQEATPDIASPDAAGDAHPSLPDTRTHPLLRGAAEAALRPVPTTAVIAVGRRHPVVP